MLPDPNDLWAGIGGHFDTFSQVIAEFVDNSIGNFEGKKPPGKSIVITIEPKGEGQIWTRVEDTGTGIDDFQKAMRLGDRTARQSIRNEHGFGMKHALASANPNNDAWLICSRTSYDFKHGGMRPPKLDRS